MDFLVIKSSDSNVRTLPTGPVEQEIVVLSAGSQQILLVTPGGSPGPQGPAGEAGLGVILLEAGQTTPPTGTPVGTLIYRKSV